VNALRSAKQTTREEAYTDGPSNSNQTRKSVAVLSGILVQKLCAATGRILGFEVSPPERRQDRVPPVVFECPAAFLLD